MPTKYNIQVFWNSFWDVKNGYNTSTPCINKLKTNYCANANQKNYKTISKHYKMHFQKSRIISCLAQIWLSVSATKKYNFIEPFKVSVCRKTLSAEYDFPAEVVLARTILIPKTENTKIAKNYFPIACLSLMYKLYTLCLTLFIQDHCERNEIATDKQARRG